MEHILRAVHIDDNQLRNLSYAKQKETGLYVTPPTAVYFVDCTESLAVWGKDPYKFWYEPYPDVSRIEALSLSIDEWIAICKTSFTGYRTDAFVYAYDIFKVDTPEEAQQLLQLNAIYHVVDEVNGKFRLILRELQFMKQNKPEARVHVHAIKTILYHAAKQYGISTMSDLDYKGYTTDYRKQNFTEYPEIYTSLEPETVEEQSGNEAVPVTDTSTIAYAKYADYQQPTPVITNLPGNKLIKD